MGILDRLLKAEQTIRKKIEGTFGEGTAQTPLEIRRRILEEVESRIVVDKGGRSFPFGAITVRLQPPTAALRDVFNAVFVQDNSLAEDVREVLKDSGARYPHNLQVSVETGEQSAKTEPPSPMYRLEFETAERRQPELLNARLVVVQGTAERAEYALAGTRTLIGRMSEVADRDGQVVRRNEVVFLDNGDEINSTVGRAHARIHYDPDKRQYRIVDEVSRYGTRVFRAGRSIEVAGGNQRGIRLVSGDEIYLGRACLRFESDKQESGVKDQETS